MTDEKNSKLAYEALDLALANSAHFWMGTWVTLGGRLRTDEQVVTLADLTAPPDDLRNCGTTACYAGWVVAAAGEELRRSDDQFDMSIAIRACELLGIEQDFDRGIGDRASAVDILFYGLERDISEAVFEVFGPRPESV